MNAVIDEPPFSRATLVRGSVIVLAGLLVFYPVLDGSWLWDDDIYFAGNSLLREPGRLWKAWFVPGSFTEYYPITQTVQWIQWQLWGEQTFGYHLTNVLLHILNALLLWRLLARFGLRWAWLGGLLFAVHPMNVESVAYISELKNTLSLPPFLLALCAYLDFEEHRRPRDYLLALAFFLTAMLCKIAVMTFPFLILLYAWWKRRQIDRDDLRRAAPFLLISLLLGAITLWSGRHAEELFPSHPATLPTGSWFSRLPLAAQVISTYFIHFLWPVHPLPMYPRWSVEPVPVLSFIPWCAWLAGCALLWRAKGNWARAALLGLGFFWITLLPFSGIVFISYMNFTWVMDHFLYVPMIGLIALVVALLGQMREWLSPRLRPWLIGGITVAMLVLATRSQDYAAVWTDRASLWTYTLARNPGAWLAHYNLGNDLRLHNRYDEAADQYEQAIRLNPTYDWAYNNLGIALGNIPGRSAEAIAAFHTALQLRPGSAEVHNNLASVLLQEPGQEDEAISEYQAALRIKPDFVEAKYNLGQALEKAGRPAEAREQFEEILKIDPQFAPALSRLGKTSTEP